MQLVQRCRLSGIVQSYLKRKRSQAADIINELKAMSFDKRYQRGCLTSVFPQRFNSSRALLILCHVNADKLELGVV